MIVEKLIDKFVRKMAHKATCEHRNVNAMKVIFLAWTIKKHLSDVLPQILPILHALKLNYYVLNRKMKKKK